MPNFTIQTPLMVFDRVHRRTGTIERTCIFTNEKSERLELEVRYDFPEHSWVQIYGGPPNTGAPIDGQALILQPGENQVLLSLNTDNFNFPDRRFKGRISFQEKEEGAFRDWIEINFEDVLDLEPFLGFAAIDLGTSSSTISLYHIQRDAVRREPWTPRLERNETEIPSAVFIKNYQKFSRGAEGGCLMGEEALQAYRGRNPRDPRCLQLSTKRLIGSSRVLATDEKGTGGFVDPLNILHSLGKFVREQFQNHQDVQALLRKVSVTFPPTWSYRHLSRWRELFQRLGFREQDLDLSLDEASAAGLFYIYNCLKERDSFNKLLQDLLPSEAELSENGTHGKSYTLNLLSFDFGGGTIDLALLEARLEILSKTVRLRLSLLGSDSCDYGGNQVTLTVFKILKRRLAMSLCDPSRMHEERVGSAARVPAEPPAPVWLPPRPGSLGTGARETTFLLPDGSRGAGWTPRSCWDECSGRMEASREVLLQNWGYLTAHISRPQLERDLEDAVDTIFPTRFLPSQKDLFRFEAKKNFDWLWERAEHLKRQIFDAVNREHGSEDFPSFDCLKKFRMGISLQDIPDRKREERIPWSDDPVCSSIISVGADEIFDGISQPLETALAKARNLAGSRRVDRVALSGQSCRIPVVRWMFSRPNNEGGLGIPAAKIDFDEENAKAAVSKGACLLHVMRETLVGFDVDIADFNANLLADIFYLQVDGTQKILFRAGSIDDFTYFEETPETRSFPKYLSVFYGSEQNLIGQLMFGQAGEDLSATRISALRKLQAAEETSSFPSHQEVLQLRENDRPEYARRATALLKLSDRERIAWMEETAAPGTPENPVYRYYLTRNHALFAVCHGGEADRRLHELRSSEGIRFGLNPQENPFSGIH